MNTQTTASEIIARKSLPSFNTLANATSYRNRAERPGKWVIILGDNNLLWVVSNREASILVKAGYELA